MSADLGPHPLRLTDKGPVCSIPGCGKGGKLRRGWCGAHYHRWQAHGDPLAGGTFHGKPMAFLEAALASETENCIPWPFYRDKNGYGMIGFRGKVKLTHRVVCELAHGAPLASEHEAAHSCGNGHGGCINPKHLRWASRAENEADKLLHGTVARGKRSGAAKLTEADVIDILRSRGAVLQRDLAARFGVSQSLISRIYAGKDWGWLAVEDVRHHATGPV